MPINKEFRPYCTALLLIAFTTIAAYCNILQNEYALDDLIHIVSDLRIRGNGSLPGFFLEPTSPGNLYRPLVQASFGLTHRISGLNPFPFHLTDLISHLICSILVFLVAKRLTDYKTGLASGIIFSILPIHSEAVANISGRYELWSALFGLSALLISITPGEKPTILRTAGIFLFFLLSLLSKENTVTLLLIMPLCWHLLSRSFGRLFLANYLPLFAALGTYLTMRFRALDSQLLSMSQTSFVDNPLINEGLAVRAVNGLYLLGKYLLLTILPSQLSADYSYNQIPVAALNSITTNLCVSLVVILIAALSLNSFFSKRNPAAFALLWFFAAFAVTSNILFPIGTIFGERLAYLPSAGICILLAWVIVRQKNPIYSFNIGMIFTVFYLMILIPRNLEWKDNATLHSAQIQISPNSARTQSNYGALLLSSGRYQDALGYYGNALEILPNEIIALHGMATSYMQLGNFAKADEIYKQALAIEPHNKQVLTSYSQLKLITGDLESAGTYLNKAISIYGEDPFIMVQELALFIAQRDQIRANNIKNYLVKNFPETPQLGSLIRQGIESGVLKDVVN